MVHKLSGSKEEVMRTVTAGSCSVLHGMPNKIYIFLNLLTDNLGETLPREPDYTLFYGI